MGVIGVETFYGQHTGNFRVLDALSTLTFDFPKEHPIVLAVQDTTSLDFTTQKAKKGMGYLDCKTSFGLKVHTTLGVSAPGVPLGLINQ